MGDQLRFKGSVDGMVVFDDLIGPTDAVFALSVHHKETLETLAGVDKIWVLEISDPDGDIEPLRMSNDPSQLVIPLLMTEETLDQAVEQRRPPGGTR